MKQTNTAYYENLFISQENVHNANIENFQIIANKNKNAGNFRLEPTCCGAPYSWANLPQE